MEQEIYVGEASISEVYVGDVLLTQDTDLNVDQPMEEIDINQVPYISTYYIKPIVDLDEEVIIEYYITDYEQKEYRQGDTSQRFILQYGVDGQIKQQTNLPAGDHAINLGKLKEGIRLIALQVIDGKGRKSHRLYQEIKVINKVQYTNEIEAHKYYVTEADLINYSISKDNTNPVETTLGLNQFITKAIEKGYKKIILPVGSYRIDENSGIVLKNLKDFTLDLNGSTLKLNPNALDKTMMISIIDCQDCHVVNGTLEGDVNEHNYAKAPNQSEWVNAIIINGGAYNSFEDLMIKDITGYGTNTMFGEEQVLNRTPDYQWQLGDIINGTFINATNRYSSTYMPLAEFRTDNGAEIYDYRRKGFVQVGAYLGYQGNVTDNWVLKVTFYDINKDYIEEIEAYAYRRIYLPKNAEYARITLFSPITPNSNIRMFCLDSPLNCSFKNIYHQNVRCVGMALNAFINLLVEGCTFDNCGYALGSSAVDAEDGWDLMQDLTFRKNNFMNNTQNGFLACAGHNFVIEDNPSIRMYFWERTRNYVSRRNQVTQGADYRYQDMTRTAYVRIYENTNYTRMIPTITSENGLLVMRNETYLHNLPTSKNNYFASGGMIQLVDSNIIYEKGKDITGAPKHMQFINCIFNYTTAYLSDHTTYINCTFNECGDMRLHGTANKTFIGCIFNGGWFRLQGYPASLFKDCIINDLELDLSGYDYIDQEIRLENCKIEMNGLRHLISLNTGTPLIVKDCQICNNNTTYKIVNCNKNGRTGIKLVLQSNVFVQDSGYIITGVNLTVGSYTFELDGNQIEGMAGFVDTKYENNDVVTIIKK